MKPKFALTDEYFNTSYAPLCVLGHVLWEHGELDMLRNFAAIPMKKIIIPPAKPKIIRFFLLIFILSLQILKLFVCI